MPLASNMNQSNQATDEDASHRLATAPVVLRADTTVTQAVRPKTSTRGMVDTPLVTHVAVSKTLHGLEMTYPSIQA